jgi:RNA polymerase primary sigma factor
MRLMKNPAGFAPIELASDVPPEPQADGLNEARNEATEALAARGRERGFVTSEDLLDRLPEMQLSPEQIEEFLAHLEQVLRDEGIEVIDVPGEDADDGVETDGARRRRRDELLESPASDPVRMYLKEISRVISVSFPSARRLTLRSRRGRQSSRPPMPWRRVRCAHLRRR